MSYLTQNQLQVIEDYRSEGRYDDAIVYINKFLLHDPTNDELLLHIADLQYKK